jgi:hypothetical protein
MSAARRRRHRRRCTDRGGTGNRQVPHPGLGRRGRGDPRFRVILGRSDEVERSRPFGSLVEALDRCVGTEPRTAEIGRLLRGDGEVGRPIEPARDPGLQFRIVDCIVDLVEQLALDGPVALALDDVQWADPSTLLTLRFLARRLADLPLALVLTARPLPREPDLAELLDGMSRSGATQFTLGPLAADAVTRLVADLVSAEPSAALLDRADGAAGNPRFVIELVTALGAEGAIETVDGRAELRSASQRASLRRTILGS